MDCSMPGLSVFHCLSEFVQIHVHGVGDAAYPSHLIWSILENFYKDFKKTSLTYFSQEKSYMCLLFLLYVLNKKSHFYTDWSKV